jgi:regulator of RNase E activity RraA
VKPGDILVADEGEMACCVIPREKLDGVLELLPVQKEADDGLLEDVKNGMDFNSALKRWPKHYSNH